ncbi:MAG: hypothetical protein AAGA54_24060 [Myxococcota bacterium]
MAKTYETETETNTEATPIVAEPLPTVSDAEFDAYARMVKERDAMTLVPSSIIVKTDDCARLPPRPEPPKEDPPQDVFTFDEGGHCFTSFYVEPFASYNDEPYLRWALGVSKLANVEKVFVCEWLEDKYGGHYYEAYAELTNGNVTKAAAFDSAKDTVWHRIESDRASHEHMWKHWPLSEVARQLGYTSRSEVVLPRASVLQGGRVYPPDTVGFENTLFGYVPERELQQLKACAAAAGRSPDAWLDAQAKTTGADRLVELGRQVRVAGERRLVELALSAKAYQMLQRAAFDADTSVSHVVQRLIIAKCPVPER